MAKLTGECLEMGINPASLSDEALHQLTTAFSEAMGARRASQGDQPKTNTIEKDGPKTNAAVIALCSLRLKEGRAEIATLPLEEAKVLEAAFAEADKADIPRAGKARFDKLATALQEAIVSLEAEKQQSAGVA